MFADKQQQRAEAGAVAVQAQGNVELHIGLTVDQVREVALQAVKAEFYQLSQMAADAATGRAQRICDDFLEKLQAENPAGLNQANEPDFQYALFAAQKAYARTGNDELEPLLVDLLVSRTKEEPQQLRKIVLSESLDVVSKITAGQINALAVIFLLKRTVKSEVRSFEEFVAYCDTHIKPFIGAIATGRATYGHLQYANCGAVDTGETSFYSILHNGYFGVLQGGFNKEEIPASLGPTARKFLRKSDYDGSKFKVLGRNTDDLEKLCKVNNVLDEEAKLLVSLMTKNTLTEVQITQKLLDSRPYLADFLSMWKSSEMSSFNLTSVGLAIGHAAAKQHLGDYSDLSTWID